MPYTPYHFGVSGTIGMIFRRWIDVPVFILVNVMIDVEVLAFHYFSSGYRCHQYWHFHTLLVGGIVGAIFGTATYFIFNKPLKWAMNLIKFPYIPNLTKMIVAGILGAWLHVLIDDVYHFDVQMFWPYKSNIFNNWITWRNYRDVRKIIELVCILCYIPFTVLCIMAVRTNFRTNKPKQGQINESSNN